MVHESSCIDDYIFNNELQIIALDVTQFSSHDVQVGHSLWRLLTLQIAQQLVEVANNFSHKVFRNLRKKSNSVIHCASGKLS